MDYPVKWGENAMSNAHALAFAEHAYEILS